jgi:Major capsid protein 13-like
MAIGKASDVKVYNPQIQAGLIETLTQISAIFGEASRGCIRLATNRLPANYAYEAFWQNPSGLITRRDTTAVTTATDIAMTQSEFASVKVNRKIGPVAQTLDAFRKIGKSANENSLDFMIGTQVAKAMQVEMCDTALLAARAAFNAQSSIKYTIPTNGTMTTAGLVNGLAKRGDRATDVALWVMHSKVYYDLVLEQIAAKIEGIANFNVATATPVSLNRPILVTDSPSLIVVSGTSNTPITDYLTLGLTPGAITVEDSEEEYVAKDIITGLENLVVRVQGEFAYNLSLKGFTWDVGNGGANPSNAAIGTGSNWDTVMASLKDWGGVIIQSR